VRIIAVILAVAVVGILLGVRLNLNAEAQVKAYQMRWHQHPEQ
jgi:hypothetical protein